MSEEAQRALEGWRPGMQVDLYDWTRHVTMRVAMRALFGLAPVTFDVRSTTPVNEWCADELSVVVDPPTMMFELPFWRSATNAGSDALA